MNWIIFKFALRNIFLHKLKTFIVGTILVFGTFIGVLGNSLVDAIASGMKNSITQSVTGDLHIYSSQAKEKLSVFGNVDGSPSDVGYVNHFTNIKEALMKVSNVKDVVPMGTNFAIVNPGNVIDIQVEKMRKLFKAYSSHQVPDPDMKKLTELENSKAHLKSLLVDLQESVKAERAEVLLQTQEDLESAKINLKQVLSDPFWLDFNDHYEERLELIGNKVAPLIFDDNMLFFNYLGTNISEFQKNFSQFEIVKGQIVPPGEKGFLIHDYIYETFVKNRVARRLDLMKKNRDRDLIKIANSKELQDQVKANKEQLADLALSMEYVEKPKIAEKLKTYLKSSETDLRKLLELFFDLTDTNFDERYQFFYAEIVPSIQLYKINIGEVIPLTAMTKLGSSSAINIKVWGTFRFKSFENSPLAGNFSLIDLGSFRELYGFLTANRRAQQKEIESEMALKDFGKEDIESLFGEKDSKPSESPPSISDSPKVPSVAEVSTSEKTKEVQIGEKENKNKISNSQLSANGAKEEDPEDVFVSAALFLKNPLKGSETLKDIETMIHENNLGVQVVDWQSASGMVGQMTGALRLILSAFVLILFIIAGIMIMNSLLMATMDRQQEIGTMRAIGAPRTFVYKVFLIETALISLIFGVIGTGLALLLILTLGRSGIPAKGEIAQFFFSGPRLYFNVHWDQIGFVFLGILGIAFLATQYPAWRAVQISPLKAMQQRN